MEWVRREFGPSPLGSEHYGPQPVDELLQQRDELVDGTRCAVDLARALMERERWDLFMVGFGATHRGGHKLWDHCGALGETTPGEEKALATALKDVYVACDQAVGELVDAS